MGRRSFFAWIAAAFQFFTRQPKPILPYRWRVVRHLGDKIQTDDWVSGPNGASLASRQVVEIPYEMALVRTDRLRAMADNWKGPMPLVCQNDHANVIDWAHGTEQPYDKRKELVALGLRIVVSPIRIAS